MADALLTCPKCGGAMEQGFLLEKTKSALQNEVTRWAPGAPKKSFFTTVKNPSGTLPVGSFRCAECGYLEFYAGDVFEPK